MHPKFWALFKLLVDQNVDLSVSEICKSCNINGIGFLKRVPKRKVCYRWLFGKCKKTCPSGHEHLTAAEIPEKFADDLCNKIKDGLAVMITVADGQTIGEPQQKKLKSEAGGPP